MERSCGELNVKGTKWFGAIRLPGKQQRADKAGCLLEDQDMRRGAFTLVELLIVVIILGILAAVVIPQFSDAGTDTRVSSLSQNLQSIRGQIELYKLQHKGTYPAVATFADQMTLATDASGSTTATTKPFGPYMQRIPNNPFSNANDVSGTVSSDGTKGWYYDGAATFNANDGGTTNGVAHNAM
jgi:general secretion pathway protein G